jgi:uncharacterized membrane protein required for colicin V production
MLPVIITLAITLAVAYAYLREGVFTATIMFWNVFLSGLVAFNYWEPLADYLGPQISGTFLKGYEDAIALFGIFTLTLGILRMATNYLAPTMMQFPLSLHRAGGFVAGLLTGYLLAGFLFCVLQTLPWSKTFMFFDPSYQTVSEPGMRRFLPPDRVWLATMYRAGAFTFANREEAGRRSGPFYDRYKTFDKTGSFELRYERYRRYGPSGEADSYTGTLPPLRELKNQ